MLAAEGGFALLVPLLVGPMSDATQTSMGRRRPYMLLALVPVALTLAAVAFMPDLLTAALALSVFFFAYYIYEPPYRWLYPDCLDESVYDRSQGVPHLYRGAALGGALVVGASIDLFDPWLQATDGYAAVWPTVAVPILAVVPLVALLADAERGIRAGGGRPAV